jgi:hypothetical protein
MKVSDLIKALEESKEAEGDYAIQGMARDAQGMARDAALVDGRVSVALMDGWVIDVLCVEDPQ